MRCLLAGLVGVGLSVLLVRRSFFSTAVVAWMVLCIFFAKQMFSVHAVVS